MFVCSVGKTSPYNTIYLFLSLTIYSIFLITCSFLQLLYLLLPFPPSLCFPLFHLNLYFSTLYLTLLPSQKFYSQVYLYGYLFASSPLHPLIKIKIIERNYLSSPTSLWVTRHFYYFCMCVYVEYPSHGAGLHFVNLYMVVFVFCYCGPTLYFKAKKPIFVFPSSPVRKSPNERVCVQYCLSITGDGRYFT